MSEIAQWLHRKQRQGERHRRFTDALVTDGKVGYVAYRLKFLSIRMLLKAALHLAEMSLFARYFEVDFLAGVILVRSAVLLAISLWWGGLEQLREEVRTAVFSGQQHLATVAIEKWLSLSILFSGITTVMGVAVILLTTDEKLGFSIYNAYAIACFIRLGLDVTARTYHSGMFAIKRIYRPLWSILLGDFLDVALVLALWPWLGVWSFSIAFLLVGVMRFVLLLHFVKRSYHQSRLRIHKARLWRSMKTLRLAEIVGSLKHGTANATALIDVLFIVVLTLTAKNDEMMLFAVAMYVLRPFVSAGYSWSRLFYFDFKVLLRWRCALLTARFERFVKKVAILFSVIVGILCVSWTWIWSMWELQSVAWLFLPLLLSRSVFGLYQVLGFSYVKYGYLAKISIGAILVFGALVWWFSDPFLLLLGLSLGLVVIVLLFPPPAMERPDTESVLFTSLPDWLSRAANTTVPVQLGVCTVDPRILSASKVQRAFSTQFADCTFVKISRYRFAWFTATPVTRTQVVQATAGAICELKIFENVSDEGELLRMVSTHVPLLSSNESPLRPEQLKEKFGEMFSTGVCLDAIQGVVSRKRVSSVEVKELVSIMVQFQRRNWQRSYRVGNNDVSVFAPGGVPQLVFWVPRDISQQKRDEWHTMVSWATILHSVPHVKSI
ncbi:MAG: hypothetical protein JXX29_13500 [Deltaproteobacteria bacterium]|nr:hypothetical protein [Deltaproteobacteria bacterium]MBN2672694.1 hypothetical protein [Deltaproteobacteria bacterium]